jgi:hypothetical protein
MKRRNILIPMKRRNILIPMKRRNILIPMKRRNILTIEEKKHSDKRPINNVQNTTQNTEDRATGTPAKTGVDSGAPER